MTCCLPSLQYSVNRTQKLSISSSKSESKLSNNRTQRHSITPKNHKTSNKEISPHLKLHFYQPDSKSNFSYLQLHKSDLFIENPKRSIKRNYQFHYPKKKLHFHLKMGQLGHNFALHSNRFHRKQKKIGVK